MKPEERDLTSDILTDILKGLGAKISSQHTDSEGVCFTDEEYGNVMLHINGSTISTRKGCFKSDLGDPDVENKLKAFIRDCMGQVCNNCVRPNKHKITEEEQ